MISDYLYFQGVPKPLRQRGGSDRRARSTSPVRPGGCANDREAQEFFEALFAKAGLVAGAYRGSALRRRVPACLRFVGERSLDAALRKLDARPELVGPAIGVVLLGVTGFFRDGPVFDHLRGELRSAWDGAGRRRIWSAACSDGHELYSVAMLLRDQGMLPRCELLGTDCRAEAVEHARRGEFELSHVGALEQRLRRECFHAAGHRVHVREELRLGIRWKQADMFSGVERGPWDLILWRNMAIYLDPAAAEHLWGSLASELAADGYLVTGKAERPPAGLGLQRVAPCIYRKSVS